MKNIYRIFLFGVAIVSAGNAAAQFNLPSAIREVTNQVGGGKVPTSESVTPGVPDAEHIINTLSKLDTSDQAGPRFEYLLGYAISSMVLGNYKAMDPSSPISRYIDQVGQTVALASNNPYPYRGYLFIVLESPEVNAFAAPGGFVFITTGMIKFLRNEDELAGVLGHEVAHIELNHGLRTLKEGRGWKTVGELFSLDETMLGPVYDELNKSMQNGYSADMEAEADGRSAEITSKLGYNAAAFADVLERFRKQTGSYGGAQYPAERGGLYAQKLQQVSSSTAAVPARTERFAQILGLVP